VWARNKPVIASAIGEMPYRIKHMVNGLFVLPRDPKALAEEAIIMLLNDENLRIKLGREGKKNVLTWSQIALRIITYIVDIDSKMGFLLVYGHLKEFFVLILTRILSY
jgi:glycosyltransferase involved in cell wall biosynthesis